MIYNFNDYKIGYGTLIRLPRTAIYIVKFAKNSFFAKNHYDVPKFMQ